MSSGGMIIHGTVSDGPQSAVGRRASVYIPLAAVELLATRPEMGRLKGGV